MKPLAVIILAAGKGTRMGGDIPKVCHEVAGKPMIVRVLKAMSSLKPARIVVVVGYMAERVAGQVKAAGFEVEYAHQKKQCGTGHAVKIGLKALKDFVGDVMVRYGDTPLISVGTLGKLHSAHRERGSRATLLSAVVEDPATYGRVVRGHDGNIEKIVEDRNADVREKQIKEINAGVYVFDKKALEGALRQIAPNPVNKEYYLTDVVRVLSSEGVAVQVVATDSSDEIIGVNTKEHLGMAERLAGSPIGT
jgi:UDP-N-acetylglucosamine diphosphorylase/glucosamine-1-phosphate N-acetyltransferase